MLTPHPSPVRIGAVGYLNTLPLVEGLAKLRGFSLTLAPPANLIDLLLAREIDLGLVSLIDAQRSPEPLALLPVGMIASDGPTLTVRLFAAGPIEKIRDVAVDAESHTSVALLRLILARRYGIRPRITPTDLRAGAASVAASLPADNPTPDAMLLIGDKVITGAPDPARYRRHIDLGQEWKSLTGLPFVYALWMCRQEDTSREWLASACATLDRARRHNATRLDWIVAAHAPARGWGAGQARDYLARHLQYEVTAAHRAAVELFFDLCAQDGLIPERRSPLWADAATAAHAERG